MPRIISFISACSVGMDGSLLLESITNAGEPSYQGGRFAWLTVAQLPLPLFFVQPDPVSQDALGLIRQEVHDVMMGSLQRIEPMQLTPEHEDAGIGLIGIEVESALALRRKRLARLFN